MSWIKRQYFLWRDYGDEHPYRAVGAIAFMLVGGIIWGSLVGAALRPLVHPPSASPPPTPVFTSIPSIKPMRKPITPRPEPPQPTYRPRPRPTTPHPTPTSHTPSPTPTRTKVSHEPCWPLCSPTPPPPDTSSPTPGSQGNL